MALLPTWEQHNYENTVLSAVDVIL